MKLIYPGTTRFISIRGIPVPIEIRIATKITPFNKYVKEYLRDGCLTWKWLWLPCESREVFLDELVHWDGSKSRSNIDSFWYDSTQEINANVVQLVASVTGRRAFKVVMEKTKEHHNNVHRIYISRETTASPSKSFESEYKGKVYCVTTENGFFVIRRNGKVSVTGNSEAANWMLNWGLVPVHEYLKSNWNRLHAAINIPRHDALVMSVPFECLYEVCAFTLGCLERPRRIFGNWLTVPCTIKVGKNDAKGCEFKVLPSRDDFMQQVEAYLRG